MKKCINLFIVFFCSQLLSVNAQTIPQVGKPCPDFLLSYVTHFPKKQVTLSDFKGKWLFLDFWFTGCASCIASFPKINALQKEFDGKAQFLMVGVNDKYNKNIITVFEKLRANQGLNIASSYDSVLVRTWGIRSMPHIVVVDPDGLVRYITTGFDLTKEKVKEIVQGEEPTLEEKDKPLPIFVSDLAKSNGKPFPKDKILNHSVLTKWNGEVREMPNSIGEFANLPDQYKVDGLKYTRLSLEILCSAAYLGKIPGLLKFWGDPQYGQIYPYPIYELKDASLFQTDGESNGVYNYSLFLRPNQATKEMLMTYMQQDLERVFGYYGVVEEREMPVWKLVAKPGAEERLKTKGGPRYYSATEGYSIVAGFSVKNVPMKDYLMYLCFYLNNTEKHPFIDATGISSNIDLTIDADLTSLDDVKKALQKKGLDLVLGTKKMPVLVIRDSKQVASSK